MSEPVLELRGIFHSGQVEPSSWTQRLFGGIETGLILKDISLEVRPGEVFAVLGSKGSGKRALLDVISRRAQGATRGQILFEGQPLTLSLFQTSCGYVRHRTDLIPSLTTEQSLYYSASLSSGEKVSRYTCSTRVRQLLSDLALNQVAQHNVSALNPSQLRRLIIGMQLIKDPVLILLDEPTAGLDPLSTYLVVSILSGYARRRGRAVVLTMEKPRSDVFPFLDVAAFLCLGEVLYAGPTRLMLDYFTSIGFPCPATENPLMYYLCLSTVDRRSRERFVESHAQILELVDKFKNYSGTGGGYPPRPGTISGSHRPSRYRKPSTLQIFASLYQRLIASTFNVTSFGLVHLFLRLFLFPVYSLFIFLLYFNSTEDHLLVNGNGLIYFSLLGAYLCSIFTTSFTFDAFRTRYYQEAQEGMYGAPTFLTVQCLFSVPFSLATVTAASRLLFQLSGRPGVVEDWALFGAVLWTSYFLAEQQTVAILMVVKSEVNALLVSSYLCLLYIIIGSGVLRSYGGMPEWILYIGFASQAHYSSSTMSQILFGPLPLPNCTSAAMTSSQTSNPVPSFSCKPSENFILSHRSSPGSWDPIIALVLPLLIFFSSLILYVMPLPSFIKSKFRD